MQPLLDSCINVSVTTTQCNGDLDAAPKHLSVGWLQGMRKWKLFISDYFPLCDSRNEPSPNKASHWTSVWKTHNLTNSMSWLLSSKFSIWNAPFSEPHQVGGIWVRNTGDGFILVYFMTWTPVHFFPPLLPGRGCLKERERDGQCTGSHVMGRAQYSVRETLVCGWSCGMIKLPPAFLNKVHSQWNTAMLICIYVLSMSAFTL